MASMLSMRMVTRRAGLHGRAHLLREAFHRAAHARDVAARQIERHPLAAQRANPTNVSGDLIDRSFEGASTAALWLVGERQHISRRESDAPAGFAGHFMDHPDAL